MGNLHFGSTIESPSFFFNYFHFEISQNIKNSDKVVWRLFTSNSQRRSVTKNYYFRIVSIGCFHRKKDAGWTEKSLSIGRRFKGHHREDIASTVQRSFLRVTTSSSPSIFYYTIEVLSSHLYQNFAINISTNRGHYFR